MLGEAMSRGVLCISSDCETGPRDFILDGVNGFLFPVKDVDALAAVMQRVIDGEISIEPSKSPKALSSFMMTITMKDLSNCSKISDFPG